MAILLTYGPDRDWLKNLTAAGGGHLRRHGRTQAVCDLKVVTRDEAAAHVTGVDRRVFPKLPFENCSHGATDRVPPRGRVDNVNVHGLLDRTEDLRRACGVPGG